MPRGGQCRTYRRTSVRPAAARVFSCAAGPSCLIRGAMSQSRRFDPQHEKPSPARSGRSPSAFRAATARWAVRGRWRWGRWQAIIRLLPVAGRAAVAAMVLNLAIGVLPLGLGIGTTVAIGRGAGGGGVVWGGGLLAGGRA